MVHVHHELLRSNSKERGSMDFYFWIYNHLLAELYLTSLPITKSKQLGELLWGWVGWGSHQVELTPKGKAGSFYFVTKVKKAENTTAYRTTPLCQKERLCRQSLIRANCSEQTPSEEGWTKGLREGSSTSLSIFWYLEIFNYMHILLLFFKKVGITWAMRLCAMYLLLYKYFCIKKYHPMYDFKNNYSPFQQMDIHKLMFKNLCKAPQVFI